MSPIDFFPGHPTVSPIDASLETYGGSLFRYFSAAFVGIHGESKPTSLKEKHSFDLMFLMVVKMFSP